MTRLAVVMIVLGMVAAAEAQVIFLPPETPQKQTLRDRIGEDAYQRLRVLNCPVFFEPATETAPAFVITDSHIIPLPTAPQENYFRKADLLPPAPGR